MKMLCAALLMCVCLLQGCESWRPASSANATITAQTPVQVVAALNRLYDVIAQQ